MVDMGLVPPLTIPSYGKDLSVARTGKLSKISPITKAHTRIRMLDGAQNWNSYQGQVSLWIQVGGDPKKFLNGISVYFKQWKGASTQENLDALRRVAETTGSGVAVWELSRSA